MSFIMLMGIVGGGNNDPDTLLELVNVKVKVKL